MVKFARAVALALGVALAISAPALARTASNERSDNTFTFSYDPDTGEIGTEASSRRVEKDDPVDFLVAVREAEGTGPGLLGKIQLRLNGDSPVAYRGWLSLSVSDANGEVAYRRMRPVDIRLVPQPGRRRAVVRFGFDLLGGNYSTLGAFHSST